MHQIDFDNELLLAVRAELGTGTVNSTVMTSRRAVCASRTEPIVTAINTLADFRVEDRESAWRDASLGS